MSYPKTRAELNSMTVAQLRDYARKDDIRQTHTMTGVEIISLSKEDLILRLINPSDRLRACQLPESPTTTASGASIDHETYRSKDSLADAIAEALEGRISAGINHEELSTIIDNRLDDHYASIDKELNDQKSDLEKMIIETVEAYQPKVNLIEVTNTTTGSTVQVGLAHKKFQSIMEYVEQRLSVWMVGESGSGKSHIAKQVADALGLDFYPLSVCPQTTKSDLLGFTDAHSSVVRTPVRNAFEYGGVLCIDEADGGNGSVMLLLNAMLSNGWCSFPDGTIQMHVDFVCLAGANTYGTGGDVVYCGRMKLDRATLNRFSFEVVDIDEDLETALALRLGEDAMKWCRRVQELRRAVHDLKEKVLVTPRATFNGAKMLHCKTWDELEDAMIFQGANKEVKTRILNRANRGY